MSMGDWSTLIGMIASAIAIVAGVMVTARWLGKKFDKWTETVIDNSSAIRTLTKRVALLEGKIGNG